MPAGSVVWTAQPMAEPSSVQTPPWTAPMGLSPDSSGGWVKLASPSPTELRVTPSVRVIGGGGSPPSRRDCRCSFADRVERAAAPISGRAR